MERKAIPIGIDVYLRYEGMEEAEQQAQYTGFSVAHGHVGYLREAYHGEPYATHVLVPESFNDGEGPVAIPAATMRERLPAALEACALRYNGEGSVKEMAQRSLIEFVELAERWESEGKAVYVLNSY